MRFVVPILLMAQSVLSATVRGGFEGSNVVDIRQVSPDSFTCKVVTPPRPMAENMQDAVHTMAHFMLAIENAARQTVTVTISNIGLDDIRAGNKGVYTEAADPYALSTEGTWRQLANVTIANPRVTFTLTPSTNLAWVADGYPSTPSHISNWIAGLSTSPYVAVDTVVTTSRGRPLRMLFITNQTYPSAGKKGVVVYGREHPLEPTGSWTCQGLAGFLTSGTPLAAALLQNIVFILIPDMSPDATAAGQGHDPDDGKCPQWHFNPAAFDRLMPGMWGGIMTRECGAVYSRLTSFVDSGGRIDMCFNIHEGGADNWWGCYELADPDASNCDMFLRSYMPTTGAAWVPNTRQGYSRGGWQNYLPAGAFAIRLLGRCWEDWRSLPLGYEISHGLSADNFLTNVQGIKYFGEAIARAVNDYYGGFTRTVTVIAPNGGEALGAGASTLVTWTSTGSVANVRIDCSTDGGGSWTSLASSTPNDGAQSVALPDTNSTSCLIRILDANAFGVEDRSNGMFTIGTPPSGTITVVSPNGGETWDANWMNTVSWTSTGSIASIRIEVSVDGGAAWSQLALAAANSGSYRVNVPATPSSRCRVRVTSVQNGSVSDTSNAAFTVRATPPLPTLRVLSPDGGEVLAPGSTTVTWSSTSGEIGNAVANVGIALSIDESGSWTTLISSTPNDGSEAVVLPNVESSRCLIWIYDAYIDPFQGRPDCDPFDVSDSLFRISSTAIDATTAGEQRRRLDFSVLSDPVSPIVRFKITADLSMQCGRLTECRIAIFDMRGRTVRDFDVGLRGQGAEVLWDRSDSHGSAVQAGCYVAQLQYGTRVVSRRVLLLPE